MYTLKHIYKNFVRRLLASKFIGAIVWSYIWFVYATSRRIMSYPTTISMPALNKTNLIYAFWHNRLMMMYLMPCAAKQISILISEHSDGKIIGTVSELFGRKVIWGSSRRGWAAAIKNIFASLKQGISIAITPDGPRGPANEINSNIIKIASKSGCPIVPITYGVKRKKVFRSWDRFIFPLPFTKLSFVYGEPIKVSKHITSNDLKQFEIAIKNELDRISDVADQLVS